MSTTPQMQSASPIDNFTNMVSALKVKQEPAITSIAVKNGPYYVWFSYEGAFNKRCGEWKQFLGPKRLGTHIKLGNGADKVYNVKGDAEYRYYPYSFPAGEYKSFRTLSEVEEYLRPAIEFTPGVMGSDQREFDLFQSFLTWAHPEVKCSVVMNNEQVVTGPCLMRMTIPTLNFEFMLSNGKLSAKEMYDSFTKNYLRKIDQEVTSQVLESNKDAYHHSKSSSGSYYRLFDLPPAPLKNSRTSGKDTSTSGKDTPLENVVSACGTDNNACNGDAYASSAKATYWHNT